MKKTIIIAAIMILAAFTTNVFAQSNTDATENTNAGAKIVVPMTISETSALHFGTLVYTAAGTCVLPSNSTDRTVTGGVLLSPVSPTASNAAYNVTGTLLTNYAITLPETITVTLDGGVATMTISDLKAYITNMEDEGVTSTLSALGQDSFTLGGKLTVSTDQAGGVYSGTFDVTVDYN